MGCSGSTVAREATLGNSLMQDVKAGGISKAQFIRDNNGKIIDFYSMEKNKLGEGAFGSVRKAKHKETGNVRAVKSICKLHMKSLERFKLEIAIMKIMDHPNIIKLCETFEDQRNIYLVMELCDGGELFDRIIEAGRFSESQAALLMQQIIRAIYYMHEKSICHRDLKPENFLFASKDPIDRSTLKLIDFGLSRSFKPGETLKTKAGTPYYVAPEVLAGKHDHMSDMWSIGVIMYVLLSGHPPFSGKTEEEVLAKVRSGKYDFEGRSWRKITPDAKNLVDHLLKMNPRRRYTAEQALSHDWIKNKAPKAQNVELEQGFVNNLREFRCQNKLKKAALHLIAGQLHEGQIKALRETFMALDHNGDGLLTSVEMKEGIGKAGLTDIPKDLQQILEDVDADGSGVIDYTEFLAATMEKHMYIQEDVCWSAFQFFDRNGDGQISKHELAQVLSSDEVEEVIDCTTEQLMADLDADGDGQINFDEFMEMMRNTGRTEA